MSEDERLKYELDERAAKIEALLDSLQAEVAAIMRTNRDTSRS